MSKGMTPMEFAARIGGGVQRQHIYAWENKGTLPGLKSLLRIANAFNLRSLDLFFVSDYCDSNNNDNRGNKESSVHTNKDSTGKAKPQETNIS